MIRQDKLLRGALAIGAVLASALAQPVLAQSGGGSAGRCTHWRGLGPAAPTVRPEIGAVLIDAQRLLGDKQYKDAGGQAGGRASDGRQDALRIAHSGPPHRARWPRPPETRIWPRSSTSWPARGPG
ncbi:MAG: hypothetical protein IPF55_11585 [Rhodoferax sp.]|nr:hypothetical protein [Rhodoferax sp.]